MQHLKQIVVPVDFSTASRNAAQMGAELAKKVGATLRLIHVNDVPPYASSDQAMMISGLTFHEYSADATQKRLDELTREVSEAHGVEVVSRRLEGAAGSEIVREVNGIDPANPRATLVMIPTHARKGVPRLLLGSVAEKVVRKSECPVLTFQSAEGPIDLTKIERVHVPLDLSDVGSSCLDVAAGWCRHFDASLELVHVLEDLSSIPSIEWSVHPDQTPTEYYRKAEKSSLESLAEAAQASVGESVSTDFCVRYGFVADEIVENAKEKKADLIITSTHGYSGFRRLILGSVAERLVRTAPCPLLVVRPLGEPTDED